MTLKEKMKQAALAATVSAATMAPLNAAAKPAPQDKTPDKYKTTITLQNDSVTAVGNSGAYYIHEDNRIYVNKGDVKFSDFGFDNAPDNEQYEGLYLVHEREHQIDLSEKRVGTADMSLNEDYQRNVHLEIGALIAEKLEIRRQYKTAETKAEKSAILARFAQNLDHAGYIAAIQSGKINPDSKSSKDFAAEMAFIKESATKYRADPNDDGYRKNWEQHTMSYLSRRGESARSNPAALRQEVHAIYQIGGIDFTKYGAHQDIVLENQSILTADKMLAQGAKPQKIIAFMNEGEGPFKLAESLDVSGLSREQAQEVLQTAIVSQELAENIAGDLALGESPAYDFDFIASNLKEKTAVYLDLKSDIWEKNHTLSEHGDPEKFAKLMQQAKSVTLDPNQWFENTKRILRAAKEPAMAGELAAIKQRMAEYQGKTVNIDETITNMDKFKRPLDGTTTEEVLRQKAEKAKADADFLAEYYKQNPPQKRLSDPYQAEIMDLNSDMLKDELAAREKSEQEKKIKPHAQRPTPTTYTLSDGGIDIAIPNTDYKSAELKRLSNEKGETIDVSILDGKPHGSVMIMDKDGNIKDLKLYDHGKEIDLNANALELKNEEKGGITHQYALLNGEKFGAETITEPNGTTTVAFWDKNGEIIAAANAAITQTETQIPLRPNANDDTFTFSSLPFSYTPDIADTVSLSRDTLKAELKAQQGAMPENPTSRAQQMRFDMHLQNRTEKTDTVRPQIRHPSQALPQDAPTTNRHPSQALHRVLESRDLQH